MQFDIKKYKEIMEHIDEDEEDDMEIVSFTDRDILNKVNKNGYYTLNESGKCICSRRISDTQRSSNRRSKNSCTVGCI